MQMFVNAKKTTMLTEHSFYETKKGEQ